VFAVRRIGLNEPTLGLDRVRLPVARVERDGLAVRVDVDFRGEDGKVGGGPFRIRWATAGTLNRDDFELEPAIEVVVARYSGSDGHGRQRHHRYDHQDQEKADAEAMTHPGTLRSGSRDRRPSQ
jgi:hypothetical protein